MSAQETAWQAAEEAAGALAPEADLIGRLDMTGFSQSMIAVMARAASHPVEVASAVLRFSTSLAGVGAAAARLWFGQPTPPPIPTERDRRFSDPSWEDNPAYFAVRQTYLASRRLSDDLLAAGRGDPVADGKAKLAAGLLFDAAAPTNFLPTNPAAIKRAFETGGASLVLGARNFLDDLANNRGRPRQVDRRPFELGVNLAATPGKVVFRNELIELIQYAPQTDEVHAIPLLASPPWINKYYIMDLAPGRSFFEWAIQHGHTVFAISYRNPDASMRDVTLDDYLISGPRAALDVVADITGASKIDIVGLCLGGALTAMLAAYLAQEGDDRIGSVTLLNTMLDYSEPGVLGVFTDEKTISRLERERCTPSTSARSICTTSSPVASLNWLASSFRYRRSRATPTSLGPLTTTSCPGRPRTRRRACSAAPSGMCFPAGATLPESSTRPARNPGTRWPTRTLPPPRTGAPQPSSTAALGGRTGPHGLHNAPTRPAQRRRWAATVTRCSAMRPASTSAGNGRDHPGVMRCETRGGDESCGRFVAEVCAADIRPPGMSGILSRATQEGVTEP